MHWEGKRVTVMGLGILGGGIGTVRYAVTHGADVTVTDLQSEGALASSLEALAGIPVRYVLGRHDARDFENADLIIRNPGVPNDSPFLRIAKEAKVPVETEASLFALALLGHDDRRDPPSFVIGVTGTKGKTTTATLIAEGFRAGGIPVRLTGVPKTSFLATLLELEEERAERVVVAEFSSWDLESIAPHALSPPVAVLTSFFPDHLNRHGTMEAYWAAKSAVFRSQHREDTLVIPGFDTLLRERTRDAPGTVVSVNAEDVETLPKLQLIGAHQRKNAALALAAIHASFSHPRFPFRDSVPRWEEVLRAIASFPGVPGRLELVGSVAGRRFVNDTAATNPKATVAALRAFEEPIILIAGGEDKALPYDDLALAIAQRVKHLVLLRGTASEKILAALRALDFHAVTANSTTMRDAVEAAWRESAPKDTILLSPGAASFNLFRNEFDRGDAFCRAIADLKAAVVGRNASSRSAVRAIVPSKKR